MKLGREHVGKEITFGTLGKERGIFLGLIPDGNTCTVVLQGKDGKPDTAHGLGNDEMGLRSWHLVEEPTVLPLALDTAARAFTQQQEAVMKLTNELYKLIQAKEK